MAGTKRRWEERAVARRDDPDRTQEWAGEWRTESRAARRRRGRPHQHGWLGRGLLALLVAAVALGTGWAGGYAVAMRGQVAALPRLVRERLSQHRAGPYVPYDSLPPFLVEALVATEDRAFWTNPGLSFEGIARAAVVDLEHGAFVEGASTLQEQLARDMFLSPKKTLSRKLESAVLALLITHDFRRREILALYLNEVYLGEGTYGIGQASETYFGVAPDRLTAAQCALLAGLPQAPSLDDPFLDLAAAKAREAVVLDSMVAVGDLSAARAAELIKAPLHLAQPST
jgi:membrane peptidoglycan carboxypeptidase